MEKAKRGTLKPAPRVAKLPRSRTVSPEQVAELSEQYLEKHQPDNYRIVVLRKGIRVAEDGWWEVPIKTSKKGVPSYDWINRSAEAAVDMDEAEGVHVLFM
jgi:hypothetical protein